MRSRTILTGALNIVLGAFKVWWNIGILNLLRQWCREAAVRLARPVDEPARPSARRA
jgi:hypothetical protein